MWIVKVALGRPYTFIVLALLIAIIGPLMILRMPTDIFPGINIPIISVIWNYTGLPPDEMADRIASNFERSMPNAVNDIEHIESQSLNGISVVKIFFQPNVNIDVALAQVTGVAQTQLRQLPSGTTPPLILRYDAATVPVLQLALSGQSIPEQRLFDLGNNTIRLQLTTVRGAGIPYPYGGKQRQVQVDLDQKALQAFGLSASDVNNAIGAQNLILPAGTEKIGSIEYNIKLNASPELIDEFNNLPIKVVNGATIYIHDVAHVRDGFRAANQYRPGRRPARRPDDGRKGRRCLDARHHQRREAAHGGDQGGRAVGSRRQADRRSVGVRGRGGPGRAARRAPLPRPSPPR